MDQPLLLQNGTGEEAGLPLGFDKKKTSLMGQSSMKGKLFFFICGAFALIFRLMVLIELTNSVVVEFSMVVGGEKRTTIMRMSLLDNHFGNTIHDMAASGAYATLILMVCGTAVIPLLRLVLVFACFVIELHDHHHKWRAQVLFVMDHVGRFILADHFLAAYSSIFFYMKKSFLEGEHVFHSLPHDIQMTMGSEYDAMFYLYLGSNILGSLVTHQLLVMSMGDAAVTDDKNPEERKTIFDRLPPKKEDGFLKSKYTLWFMLLISLVGFIDLTVLNSHIVTFSLEGVAGLISGAEPKRFTIWTALTGFYTSVVPVGDELKDKAPILLGAAYGITILLLPGLVMIGTFAFLTVPLKKSVQYRMLYAFPFWFSWCAVDVFLAVTLSLYFEMDVLASFLFRNKYPQICEGLELTFRMPCTEVGTEYGRGILSLLAVVVGLVFVRSRLMHLLEQMTESEIQQRLALIM